MGPNTVPQNNSKTEEKIGSQIFQNLLENYIMQHWYEEKKTDHQNRTCEDK